MPMNRARPAFALAASLSLAALAAPVAAPYIAPNTAPTAAAQAATATSMRDLSIQDKQRVVAQAVAEMINDYRVSQGLAPLFVHVDMSAFAESWSRENAKHSTASSLSGAHSRQAVEGYYSGEIVMAETTPGKKNAPQLSDAEWAMLPQWIFDAWRNSPEHNDNMLDGIHQGMGVGVVVDKNAVFATTVFTRDWVLINGGPTSIPVGSWPSISASMDKAYVPTGAREILGLGGWRAPRDPSGKQRLTNLPDERVISGGPLDRTTGLPRCSDPRLSRPLPAGASAPAREAPAAALEPALDKVSDDIIAATDSLSAKLGISEAASTAIWAVLFVVGLLGFYGPQLAEQFGITLPF